VRIEHIYATVNHGGLGRQAHVTTQLSSKDGARIPATVRKSIRENIMRYFEHLIDPIIVPQVEWTNSMPGFLAIVLDYCDQHDLVCHSIAIDPGHGWQLEELL